MSRVWTCRRQKLGVVCGGRNPARCRYCRACGLPRGELRKPAHLTALDTPYEEYVRLNGGERCGICGAAPTPGRRLDRDHDHRGTGTPRGVLCVRCNRTLAAWVTPRWLRAAATYLERGLENAA